MLKDMRKKGFIFLFPLLAVSSCASLSGYDPDDMFRQELAPEERAFFPDTQGEQPPVLPENSDLNRILAFAAANSPGLRGAFYRWQAALEAVPAAGAFPDPTFTYTYFLREIETKVGPQQHKLSVSQMIPSPGKLHQKEKVSSRAALVLYSEFELYKAKLFHDVRTSYFNYYYYVRAAELIKENIDRFLILEPVVKQAYQAGKAPYNNLIRIQISAEKEKERLETINDSLANSRFRLNALLNREPESILPPPEIPDMESDIPDDSSKDQLLTALRRNSPELAVLDRKIEQAEQGLQLAEKQDSPDFMIGADWVVTGKSTMTVEDNGKDPVMLMFGMNIPLYRAKYNSMEESARQTLRAMMKTKHDRENMLLAQSRITLNDIRASKRRISLFEKNLIEKARQSFSISRTAFEGGTGDFLDLLDTVQLIIEMQLTVEKEISNKAINTSELTLYFGNQFNFF